MPPPAKPIRVLLWSPGGSGEHYEGPAIFTFRLFSSDRRGRFEITLAHGNPAQARYDLFREQHLIAPLVPGWGTRALWRFLRSADRWLTANHDRFDVFLGLSGFEAAVHPASIAQRAGLPSIIFLANHQAELSDKPGLKGLLGLPRRRRAKARRLFALIAMSQAIYDELISYDIPPERIARIPMAVDTEQFRPLDDAAAKTRLRADLGLADVPTIVFSGAVSRRKRPHLLVEALGRAAAKGCAGQLVLAGPAKDEAYAQSIRARADAMGIGDRVVWLGFTRDIARVYQAGDLFGLTSSREGMSAAVTEAMASGLPAIVTPVSGMRDLVDDGVHGAIVEGTEDGVAAAVLRYLEDPALCAAHGRAAREKIVAHHRVEVVLVAYESLFRRAMESAG